MREGAIFPVAWGVPKSLRGYQITNIPREFGMGVPILGGARFPMTPYLQAVFPVPTAS